ncbi:nucleoside diphosphate-linked moiety X motif 19-like isoform X2 [Varroa jacobsoni]|uniref:Nudix hydrolase domain-containing protein n=1 Tax=Varroa destructor TaxID=109461 RepID=A0A7M7KYY9_VARDE|nr:nucleoside diphosphate-linked moiety X motif 19-like isoform X2 [Varroa destructor]XP_022701301.1 nucleoside diphosphate-linked moiety X motif 19-like isoform X2 [Varroa jacobsoni]
MTSNNPKIRHPMDAPAWREAASLIVACRAPMAEVVGKDLATNMIATKWANPSPTASEPPTSPSNRVSRCDYKVLMVKRSQLSSFMANAYVYPGGLAEKSDFSLDWLHVFEKCGVSCSQLREDFVDAMKDPRPPMIARPVTITHNEKDVSLDNYISASVAFRICAIREAFEETGVLLLTRSRISIDPNNNTTSSPMVAFEKDIDQNSWRQKLRSEPRAFIDMCLENGLCPNLWALKEWSDWLTPISVGHRRYDTLFYVACLDQTPRVVLDQSEVVTLRWTTPLSILEEYSAGAVFLAPPQVYEMSRLASIPSYAHLARFAREREFLGVDRWLPVIGAASDGVVSLLPGDDLYPAEPDIYGNGPGPEFPFTLEEMRARCANLNRMDVQGPFACAHCNIEPPRGVPAPISFKGESQLNFQSML